MSLFNKQVITIFIALIMPGILHGMKRSLSNADMPYGNEILNRPRAEQEAASSSLSSANDAVNDTDNSSESSQIDSSDVRQEVINAKRHVAIDIPGLNIDEISINGERFRKNVNRQISRRTNNSRERNTTDISAKSDKGDNEVDNKPSDPSLLSKAKDAVANYMKDKLSKASDYTDDNPGTAMALAGGTTALTLGAAYKCIPSFRNKIKETFSDLNEKVSDVYYDLLDKYFAHILYKWEDMQEEPLSHADLIKVGSGLTLLYGLKKVNDKYDITGKVFPVIQDKASDIKNLASKYGSLGSKYVWQFLKKNKNEVGAIVAGVTTAAILIKISKDLFAREKNYIGLIHDLWDTLSEDQIAQIDSEIMLELMYQAVDNPLVLEQTNEFMKILTDSQKKLLEKIIADYVKSMKKVRSHVSLSID